MSKSYLQSSHDFVKALKAASDPPVQGGPLKIQIAQEAWACQSFYVPSKGEVIAEWVLTKFLKEKDKETSTNSLFDARYWHLLLSLCEPRDSNANDSDSCSVKTWLTPLLHRVPLGPIVVSFLNGVKPVAARESTTFTGPASACLSTLWPIAVQRMNAEVLLECFGAFLSQTSLRNSGHGTNCIGRMISNSYRNSLATSSNKKKLHQTFLQVHLLSWLQALSNIDASDNDKTLLDAGLETLFSLDVLRQARDTKSENAVLERLQNTAADNRDLVFESVPIIFMGYVRALSRHRGSLFSQGSQSQPGAVQDEFRQSAMKFFVSSVGLVDDRQLDIRAWETRLSILRMAEQENTFDSKQQESVLAINRMLDLIVITLNDSWKRDNLQITETAVQCLSVITRIDYDLTAAVISRILPLLLQIPISSATHFELLDLLVVYHTKTRTMNTLVELLFDSISASSTYPGNAQERYQLSFASPVMHNRFLQSLAKALQNFMTESQCIPTLRYVSEAHKAIWERAYDSSHRSSKRKSIAAGDETDGSDVAVVYCLASRLSSVVLSSSPIQSLSEETLEEVHPSLAKFRSEFVHYTISKGVKALKKRNDSDQWGVEICLATNLRLLYALNVSRNLVLPLAAEAKIHSRLTEMLSGEEDVLPELILEMFRTLLYNLSAGDFSNHQDVVEHLLNYLEVNFVPSGVNWSGNGYHLTRGEVGKAESARAIMYMVVERWLPEIDRLSSAIQLKRFLKIILSIDSPTEGNPRAMDETQLLLQMVHSAQFWEFKNVRENMRETILEILDHTSSSQQSSTTAGKIGLYRVLLAFPLEYFTTRLLNDLMKRAWSFNHSISQVLKISDEYALEAVTALRIFLKRAVLHTGSVANNAGKSEAEFLIRIFEESSSLDHITHVAKEAFTRATLELAGIYLLHLFKSSKNGAQPTLKVLDTFTPATFKVSRSLSSLTFMGMVDLLYKDFTATSIHEDIFTELRLVHERLSSFIYSRVESIKSSDLQQEDVKQHADLLAQWHSLIRLDRWLGLHGNTGQPTTFVAGKLISAVAECFKPEYATRRTELHQLAVTTFAILLQELYSRPEAEHPQHLDVIISFYVYLSELLPEPNCKEMDLQISQLAKSLTQPDYVRLLTFVADSTVEVKRQSTSLLLYLVHVAALLLRDHPSHSLIHIQKFTTRCLGIFAGNSIFVDGPPRLRLEVLQMISQHCSDQQAALRTSDASGIWLLLAKYLAPSQTHDNDTQTDIFHKITSILTSLIRLRRDLVIHSLPHLGLILRQLLLLTRACRPNLGAKQTALVTSTQPRWISFKQPLGADEAKALGRLLESLNTKTTIRVPTSSPLETQKAESLAKPFSKHAAYVLKAYIEAMNDPLCILPLDVRKELQPGLFALCGMMNEHSRDALMVSALDVGGKQTMKALWKEYDKQRYIGRG